MKFLFKNTLNISTIFNKKNQMISHHKLIQKIYFFLAIQHFKKKNPTLNLACICNEKIIMYELIICDISNIEF